MNLAKHTIELIEDATYRNDHWEARRILANRLGMSLTAKMIDILEAQHHRKGSISDDLFEIRNELTEDIMKEARAQFDNIEEIRDAF